ncbi:unnamed protein product [Kuraishia capsulata CBS 1993]|uniref:Zn(2)-C6 fungal-type domain-containing protein n=1 Tax=Kuraishia capsulata CBS 1993 TaxID=1382522 RepID=W6MN54_9ASCO|nr:uncharacterized protein KUCA_T00003996001 [Kuraishia capsulata CBS 1993]CDK28016.1 unnamed protein product [Kuraishia capsulata CBS 1993]
MHISHVNPIGATNFKKVKNDILIIRNGPRFLKPVPKQVFMSKTYGTSTRRTKRFTGCWTCRKRGVRCDESRPGCKNCVIHRVKCEGYMVKLCWGNNDAPLSERRYQKTRSLMLYEWKENQLLDDIQVENSLDRIETASGFLTSKNLETSKEFGYGPFTVFSVSSKVEIGNALVDPSSEVIAMGTAGKIRERLEQTSFVGVRPNLEIEIALLCFWDRYFSKSLTPVDETEVNPNNLLLKEALDKPHPADIQRGIFHTLCAICSGFLSTSADQNFIAPEYQGTNFREYAKFHKIRALGFVSDKYSWKELCTTEELIFLVGSIYFLLVSDAFNSSDEWQIHLRGAVSALKTISDSDGGILISGQGDPEGLSSALLFFSQMTRLSYLQSTLYLLSDDVCNKNLTVQDLEFMRFPEDNMTESLVYRNSGVTPGMMKCLTRIVKYLQFANAAERQEQEVSEIQQELINCEPPAFNASLDSLNSLIVHHQSFIFYTAISLLFFREVKMQDAHNLQDLVSSGIDHMEIYQDISKKFPGLGLFWPVFIICCEATSLSSQARVTEWLNIVEQYCVDTVKRGIRVIKTVWDRRENGDQVSWLSVIREVDSSLFLA